MSSRHWPTYVSFSLTISSSTVCPTSAVVSLSGLSTFTANCLRISAVKFIGKLLLVSASATQATFVMFLVHTRVRYWTTASATSSRSLAPATVPEMMESFLAYVRNTVDMAPGMDSSCTK